jgi:SAM-dependent methyltransferase
MVQNEAFIMGLLNRSIARLRSKRRVADLSQSVDDLERWFASPLGQRLLEDEQAVLDKELSCLFGYHLMQLSINRHVRLFGDSRINHCFALGAGSHGGCEVGAYAAFDDLPLEDESVDVVILHHVLEFSRNPHQVLKEASRVTIARGFIIVLGFNPFSLMGMMKPFAQLLSTSPVWRRNSLRKSRVADWLQFLDCNTLRTESGFYSLPLQNKRYLDIADRGGRWLSKFHAPFGGFYCLIARKERVCMTPIRPDWARQSKFRVAKPALSARASARLALVKNGNKP